MRKAIAYLLLGVGVAVGIIGLAFAVAAGGYEADAVRVAGFEFLALAAVLVVAGVVILRSGA
jgi:hypothetical protein